MNIYLSLTIFFILTIAPLSPAATSVKAGTQADTLAGTHPHTGNAAMAQWRAGEYIAEEEIARRGLHNCFRAEKISDEVFCRMKGKSYKEGCTVSRTDLRYLRVLHHTATGKIRMGELVCHKSVAHDLVEIFRKLYDARYPIERMVLIDNYGADDLRSMEANNTSAFNFRRVAGTAKLSAHAMGRAVDINPLYNPYVKRRGNKTIVSPRQGRKYADRTKTFIYKINRGDICHRLFVEHGFVWGGAWQSLKDYQHFEKE